MDTYRFQNEVLEQLHRLNDLLETIAWNTAPAKFVTGIHNPGDGQSFGAAADAAVAAARGPVVPGGIEEMINVVHSMTGGGRRGEPPTPEQRAEKWAARAAQVGMPAEEAEAVRQRAEAAVAGVTAGSFSSLSEQVAAVQRGEDPDAEEWGPGGIPDPPVATPKRTRKVKDAPQA